MLDDITNEIIQEQAEFDWTEVAFPALVKSINFDVLRVAYFYKVKTDGTGYLFGGYHFEGDSDLVGLSSNFKLVTTLKK